MKQSKARVSMMLCEIINCSIKRDQVDLVITVIISHRNLQNKSMKKTKNKNMPSESGYPSYVLSC